FDSLTANYTYPILDYIMLFSILQVVIQYFLHISRENIHHFSLNVYKCTFFDTKNAQATH
ncbi:MAG: hypothetical protein IJ021_09990, partial [Clostridia bacterium]|nr:hypothetical protein [Clostridia bacterium]